LNFWDYSGNSAWYDVDLLLNQSSGSIISGTPLWTPTQGHFSIWTSDIYGRQIVLCWMFQ